MALVPAAGLAQDAGKQAPSAAEIDWRPRSQLPAEVQAGWPVFCDGGYLPSGTAGAAMPVLPAGETEAPLEAIALSARSEPDPELYLQGEVRLRQGSFKP